MSKRDAAIESYLVSFRWHQKADIVKASTKPNSDFLYAIRSNCGAVKIGRTGYKVEQRCKALETTCPPSVVLEVWQTVPNAGYLEKLVHAYFIDSRIKGEWFDKQVQESLIRVPLPDLVYRLKRQFNV